MPSTQEIKLVKARSPYAWLRPLLLLLGLLAIGAVFLLLAAYRFGQGTVNDPVDDRPVPDVGDQVLKGSEFAYTQTSEGLPLFHIEAEESRKDRDGTSFLTTVKLEVFHGDGQTYTVRSRNARVHQETGEARLEGDVQLSGWDKLELSARALEFRQQGQILESDGEVEFRYPPDFVGRASKLKVDRKNDTVTLAGGVHLHSVPGAVNPMRLDCQRLVFQRSSGILRAVGDASIKTDQQSLAAHYLTIFLAPDGHTLESVRARWKVFGRAEIESGLGDVTTVEYRGEFLDVQPDPQKPGNRRIKLDGEGEPVELSLTDLSGLKRVFSGLYLLGHARGNRLVLMEGVGDPMVLSESLDFPDPFFLRQVCAERLTARFLGSGRVSRVQLEKRVELHDTDIFMSGGRKALLDMEDGTFRTEGQEVLLSSARGEVTARQFSWNRQKGLIRARENVRAVLANKSLQALNGTPLSQGDGPVQVEAEEAYWTNEPPTFTFEGDVRAWRGDSLILAGQLLGDERESKLSASGGVRTIWVPQPNGTFSRQEPSTTASSGDQSSGDQPSGDQPSGDQPSLVKASVASSGPIEVSAERLSYLADLDQLVYENNVEVRQGRRTIACKRLHLDLEPGGRVRQMICQEDVKMIDPESGRRVEGGDRAVYTLASDLIEIFGDKVELHNQDSTQMNGKYIRYDIKTGKLGVKSQIPEGAGTSSP